MSLHELKDLSNTLEIMRRTRRDLPDGEARTAVDMQLAVLARHVTNIVGEDERLAKVKAAEDELRRSMPDCHDWYMIEHLGQIGQLVAKVLAGVAVDKVWKDFKG